MTNQSTFRVKQSSGLYRLKDCLQDSCQCLQKLSRGLFQYCERKNITNEWVEMLMTNRWNCLACESDSRVMLAWSDFDKTPPNLSKQTTNRLLTYRPIFWMDHFPIDFTNSEINAILPPLPRVSGPTLGSQKNMSISKCFILLSYEDHINNLL